MPDQYTAPTGHPEDATPAGWGRIGRFLVYAIGAAFIGIGLHGALTDPRNVPLAGWGKWFVAGVVIHDALFVPAFLILAALVVRIPPPYRQITQAMLVIGGSLTLVALPAVLGYGRRPDNPSQLPLSYGRNLVALLFALALVGATVAAVTAFRSSRSLRSPKPPARSRR